MRYILFFSITTDYFVKGHKKSRRVGTLLLAVRNDFGTQLLQLAAISNKVRKWNVTRFLIEIVESFALKKHSFIQITGVNYTRALNIKFIQCSRYRKKKSNQKFICRCGVIFQHQTDYSVSRSHKEKETKRCFRIPNVSLFLTPGDIRISNAPNSGE